MRKVAGTVNTAESYQKSLLTYSTKDIPVVIGMEVNGKYMRVETSIIFCYLDLQTCNMDFIEMEVAQKNSISL